MNPRAKYWKNTGVNIKKKNRERKLKELIRFFFILYHFYEILFAIICLSLSLTGFLWLWWGLNSSVFGCFFSILSNKVILIKWNKKIELKLFFILESVLSLKDKSKKVFSLSVIMIIFSYHILNIQHFYPFRVSFLF